MKRRPTYEELQEREASLIDRVAEYESKEERTPVQDQVLKTLELALDKVRTDIACWISGDDDSDERYESLLASRTD